MQVEPKIIWSRYSDGARPVRVLGDSEWEVLRDDGKSVTYNTAQALLTELTGHPEGRHWSLDRYFGLGRYAPQQDRFIGKGNVLDFFGMAETPSNSSVILLAPLAPDILAFRSNTHDTAITVPARRRLPKASPSILDVLPELIDLVVSGPVGIDLAHRGHEVRKLLFAGFGRRIFAAGYDPDDVLQEVYKGLLARNKGRCPWDPSKSSFGHYVYMVAGCVLSNYHRKQRRMKQFEQLGLLSYQDGEYKSRDAASNATPAPRTFDEESYLMGETVDDLVDYMLTLPRTSKNARLAIDVLPYITASVPRARIAADLGISMATVSRAVSFLRKSALAWHTSILQ